MTINPFNLFRRQPQPVDPETGRPDERDSYHRVSPERDDAQDDEKGEG